MWSMAEGEAPRTTSVRRAWAMRAAIVAVLAGWFAAAQLSEHQPAGPSSHPSPRPSSTNSASPGRAVVDGVFLLAHVRWSGETVDLGAVRRDAKLCVVLVVERLSCDLGLRPRQAIRLAYANWLLLDASDQGLGVIVVGSVGPRVRSVRVSLGAGRWANAEIVPTPAALGDPVRVFVLERRTRVRGLNRSLPIVAIGADGRPIGRTSYLIHGG